MLCQKENIKLLLTCIGDLAKLGEAFHVEISGQALGLVNVDFCKVSSVPGNQILGQFIELVDGVMQVSSTSSDFDPFGPLR